MIRTSDIEARARYDNAHYWWTLSLLDVYSVAATEAERADLLRALVARGWQPSSGGDYLVRDRGF